MQHYPSERGSLLACPVHLFPPDCDTPSSSSSSSNRLIRRLSLLIPLFLLVILFAVIMTDSNRTPEEGAAIDTSELQTTEIKFPSAQRPMKTKNELRHSRNDQWRKSMDRSKREASPSPNSSTISITTATSGVPLVVPVSFNTSQSSHSSENNSIADLFRTNLTTGASEINGSISSEHRAEIVRETHTVQQTGAEIQTRNLEELRGNGTAVASNPAKESVDPVEPPGLGGLLRNATNCVQFTEEQLVKELKQHGTYNPDFMAWDVRGVLNFFERTSTDNYDKLRKSQDSAMTIEQNLAAVEQLVKELNLQNCNLRTPDVLARLYNLSSSLSKGAAISDSSSLGDYGRLRTKREGQSGHSDHLRQDSGHSDLPGQGIDHSDQGNDQADPALVAKAKYIYDLYTKHEASRDDSSDASTGRPWKRSENEDIIGQVHLVPSGCRKRGSSEDGYLRLCSACQAIRRLPDSFFPPFLNEVTCDEDKACLYFYDYPHGKCRQKHLNLVVLKNVGTSQCQLWKRYNINVRVSCECFVDEMSFFAKYV